MRRKVSIKRKIEDLEEVKDLFLDLIDSLKHSDNDHAVQLMDLIRSGASLGEVKAFLNIRLDRKAFQRSPELMEAQEQVERHDDARSAGRANIMRIQRLVDTPPFDVPAKPWTTVTSDDHFVSHLLSLWLTWTHPFLNCLDRELFIRDMKAGNLDCEFCSPFLVNAILAEACVSISSRPLVNWFKTC